MFHGSGLKLDKLEPRQAFNFQDGQRIPDGLPAVFASPFADYAIFMALINRENMPKGYRSGVSYSNKELRFRATKDTLKQFTGDLSGYVYVFDKNDFQKRSKDQWVAYKEVSPISTIVVHLSDFTKDIEEIDD